MSNFYSNINGCLKYKDYVDAKKWLFKAQEELGFDAYSHLILLLEKSWPLLFSINEFLSFRDNIVNLESIKNDIIEALNISDYELAKNLFGMHFTYETFPEYIPLLNKYTKLNSINNFKSSVKKDLSHGEEELLFDMRSHLEHREKLSNKRVSSNVADFFITKTSHYDLSIFNDNNRTVRHLPWDHPIARPVLSAELGEKISDTLGEVSLIADFKPVNDDIRDVRYFTKKGRDYFASGHDSLTNGESSKNVKIDADNFTQVKQVVPSASQMKIIHCDGNFIIDGAAGTGKSTTLLQKLRILTNQDGIKGESIKVLVKHSGLIEPFKKLLLEMEIENIDIDFVDNFLLNQFGSNYDAITLSDIDNSLSAISEINNCIDVIFDENTLHDNIIDFLPDNFVKKTIISKDLYAYSKLKYKIKIMKSDISKMKSEIRAPIDANHELECEIVKKEQHSLPNRFSYCKGAGLRLDNETFEVLQDLIEKYESTTESKYESSEIDHPFYDIALNNIKIEFNAIEMSASGLNKKSNEISLHDHIQSKVEEKINEALKDKIAKLPGFISREYNRSSALKSIEANISNKKDKLKLLAEKSKTIIWNKALISDSIIQKKLIGFLNGNISRYQTIIIDEAQDIPNSFIEMVGFYCSQLILAGDEAQNENPDGLGLWSNLRERTGLGYKQDLLIHKLRHNYRQSYELGSLSYNYRQLLLGKSFENIESDYFADQKGFSLPAIEHVDYLNNIVEDRLDYIAKKFTKKFPLVIVATDAVEQKLIVNKMKKKDLLVLTNQDSVDADIIVLTVDKVAGREFPVIISMINESMDKNTVYIILSRAKFNMTLLISSEKDINIYLRKLSSQGMVTINQPIII